MGLPSNQGNIFYWARPLITTERKREREKECVWERDDWELAGASVAMYGSSGLTYFFRFLWHLSFFSLHPPLSLFIVPSLALSRSLTLSSSFPCFLPFSFLCGSCIILFFHSRLPSSFPFLLPYSHVSVYKCVCVIRCYIFIYPL